MQIYVSMRTVKCQAIVCIHIDLMYGCVELVVGDVPSKI